MLNFLRKQKLMSDSNYLSSLLTKVVDELEGIQKNLENLPSREFNECIDVLEYRRMYVVSASDLEGLSSRVDKLIQTLSWLLPEKGE